MDSTVIILGRDHLEPGAIHAQSVAGGTLGLAISTGAREKPNEDALGVVFARDQMVLAAADGHWGAEASELAIERAALLLETQLEPRGDETIGRLYALFEGINRDLHAVALARPGAAASETTLIVCYVRSSPTGLHQIWWGSFGDSFLFQREGTKLRRLNSSRRVWLGLRSKLSELAGPNGIPDYPGVAGGLEIGVVGLARGHSLLIATDGLVEPTGPTAPIAEADLERPLRGAAPVEQKCEALVALALERGGQDNIACLLFEVA